MTNATVRTATIADGESIARLVTELGYRTSPDQMRVRLEAILADGDYATLVACDGEQIVGFVGTRTGPLYEGDGLYGQIMALAVSKDRHRGGVGRMLMQAAESSLTQRGARVLVVTTGNQRSGAHAFYEHNGYRFDGRRYKKYLAIVALLLACGCGSAPVPDACALLTADDVASALGTTGVKADSAADIERPPGLDLCRWTGASGAAVELRVYSGDSSVKNAWTMVFESAKVHATKPGAANPTRARGVDGVGDDAFVFESGGNPRVAFRVGGTGATVAGRVPAEALIELARRAAKRL